MSIAALAVISPPAPSPSRAGASIRCQYTKVQQGVLKYVIADFYADGREDFAEQESGELGWYSFTPTRSERDAVSNELMTGDDHRGWPLLTF